MINEDEIFNQIAEQRRKQGGKFISHEEAWGLIKKPVMAPISPSTSAPVRNSK